MASQLFSSSKLSPASFVAFRTISAAVLLGHLIAHVLHRNEGWYYFMYLTHWTMILATLSECMLLALAIWAPQEPLPSAARMELALWHLVQPFSMIMALLFWTSWSFQQPAEDLGRLHYLDFYAHGLYCLQLLISLLVSQMPYSMCVGFGWTVTYSLMYTLWTGIHFQAKIGTARPCADYELQECPLYQLFTWHRPQLAIIVLLLECTVACPVICAVYAFLVRWRDRDAAVDQKEPQQSAV